MSGAGPAVEPEPFWSPLGTMIHYPGCTLHCSRGRGARFVQALISMEFCNMAVSRPQPLALTCLC